MFTESNFESLEKFLLTVLKTICRKCLFFCAFFVIFAATEKKEKKFLISHLGTKLKSIFIYFKMILKYFIKFANNFNIHYKFFLRKIYK